MTGIKRGNDGGQKTGTDAGQKTGMTPLTTSH